MKKMPWRKETKMKLQKVKERLDEVNSLIAEIINPSIDEQGRIEKGGALKESVSQLEKDLSEVETEQQDLLDKYYKAVVSPGPQSKPDEQADLSSFDLDKFADDWAKTQVKEN